MIETALQLGEPVTHRGIVVAPLFPRHRPRAGYVTLDEALPLGFRVREIDAAGSVPQLVAENPLEHAVLLYDGEELVGAKQNRILNVSVLAAPRSTTLIPVSCVEEGRWSERSKTFAAGRHAAHPDLRRRKAERLSAAPLSLGVAQGEVWHAVAEASARHGVHSPTGAQADVFRAREDDLGALRSAFPLQPGQSGAVLALGRDRLCLDYVSRPDAFARLYPKLLDGYLLDALGGAAADVDGRALDRFLAAAIAGVRSRRPSPGLGDDVRLRGEDVIGSGLELQGELVQLSVFSSVAEAGPATSIARPSRRR
jgi:hypothetical protein